jgi:hypothetical protein
MFIRRMSIPLLPPLKPSRNSRRSKTMVEMSRRNAFRRNGADKAHHCFREIADASRENNLKQVRQGGVFKATAEQRKYGHD